MNTETQNVAPDAATEIQASDPAKETPEVAVPETDVHEEASAKPEEDGDKALKRLQRRIDRRTADLYRERAERERLAQELASLRTQAEPDGKQESKAPDPVEIARQIVERERLKETVTKVLNDGKKLGDFDAACNEVASVIPFYEQSGQPSAFLRVVLEADAPARLLHHLGQNPELVEELADLSPTQQARRLDRLERELSVKPKVSAAPQPIKPVAAAARDSDLHSGLSTDEWIKRREAQLREARKR